ncbi:MAG: iron ABC transporter permease [Clostridia bacterium]|nr:iron ABC transporter permease [Clostridia bacterium]
MERQTRNVNQFFRSPWGYAVLAALLAGAVVCALRFGSVGMSHAAFFAALFGDADERTNTLILYAVRMPRVLSGVLAGMALAASGVLLQSVTDNALASPNVIGVNAGAGVGVVLALAFFPVAVGLLPLFAIVGALITTLAVLLIARRAGGGRTAVVLSGVAVTALLNAFISAATLVDSDLLSTYNSFSVGGFAGARYSELILPAIIVAIALAAAFVLGGRIDLLSLGGGMAQSMGVRVRPLRFLCILCAAALAAAAVSFAGLLGFVGLIVPHAARALVGNRVRHLLAASVLLGGTVTVSADLLGRVLLAPAEIPVGIMMALVGAPFFLGLLFWKRGSL